MSEWLLAVHSGAGRYGATNETAYLSLLRSALQRGREAISGDGTAPTAAEVATILLHSFERSVLTNAGLGSNLTEQRRVECESSVVCGRSRLVGSCATVRGVCEPSALALKLLQQAETVERGDPVDAFRFGRQAPLVVVGEQARALAREFGLETATDAELETYQVTEQTAQQWEKWHRRFQSGERTTATKAVETEDEERLDTVGAVCMDPMGNVAAALSSGGVAYKVPGRVGLAGCPRLGCDAANAVATDSIGRKRKRGQGMVKRRNGFAVACTGRGEHLIRSNFVGTLGRRLAKSVDLERALRKAFEEASGDNGGVGIEGGVLALVSAPPNESSSRPVQLGVAFTTPCMGVGFLQCSPGEASTAQVQLLRRPAGRQSTSSDGAQELVIHVSLLNIN